MKVLNWRLTGLLGLMAGSALLFLTACQQGASSQPVAVAYQTETSLQDIMRFIIDTNADDVWNAFSTVVTAEEEIEKSPQSDEEWAAVRRSALTLAEASNLLLIPGRKIAHAGESTSSHPVELEPEGIVREISQNRAAFQAYANALHEASLEIVAAVDKRDHEAILRLGGKLDHVCESCHARFWYPGERIPEFPRLKAIEHQALKQQGGQ